MLVAAGFTYDHLIPVSHVQRSRLSQLVTTAPAGFTAKPTSAAAVDAADNPFTGVKNAAKRAPNATGSYAVQWGSPKAPNDVAELLVSLLPDKASATSVLAEAKKDYLAAGSFSADGYSKAGTFALTGIPGAGTALYTSKTKGDAPVAVAVFATGRTVSVVFGSQTTGAAAGEATARALALSQHQHLLKVVPGFTLTYTTHPLWATVVYGVVSVVIAGVVVTLVILLFWWRRHEVRKEAARQEARRKAQRMYHRQRELGELPGRGK